MPFRIEFSPETEAHFDALTARQQSRVLSAIESQLTHEPDTETKKRKPMRPNPLAPWELRVEALRVYYDVTRQPAQVVFVRAIGIKIRNQVRIAGEVIEL